MRRVIVLALFFLFIPAATASSNEFPADVFLSYMALIAFGLFAVLTIATTLYSAHKNDEDWVRYIGAFLVAGVGGILGLSLIRPDLLALPGPVAMIGAFMYVITLLIAIIHLFRVRNDQVETARLLLIYFILFFILFGQGVLTVVDVDFAEPEPSETQVLTPTELICHADPENTITVTIANTADDPVDLTNATFTLSDVTDDPVYTNNTLDWTDKPFGHPGGLDTANISTGNTTLADDGLYTATLELRDADTVTLGTCVPN